MYDVSGLFSGTDATAVRPGTSLLVSGPARPVEGCCLDLLARGCEHDERTLVITTGTSAADIAGSMRERSERFQPQHLAVVDTTAGGGDVPGVAVETLGSSGDLTGISLETSKFVRALGEDARIRLGLISVSTLLMYVDLQTVFRFLHVFTSRVNSGGWLGVFALDPEMHDAQAVSTVRATFDAEARIDGDGNVELQGDGIVSGDDGA